MVLDTCLICGHATDCTHEHDYGHIIIIIQCQSHGKAEMKDSNYIHWNDGKFVIYDILKNESSKTRRTLQNRSSAVK